MKLAEKIEHFEYWCRLGTKDCPWKVKSHSRRWMKHQQHRAWRRWSKQNLHEEANQPMYNRYCGWEY